MDQYLYRVAKARVANMRTKPVSRRPKPGDRVGDERTDLGKSEQSSHRRGSGAFRPVRSGVVKKAKGPDLLLSLPRPRPLASRSGARVPGTRAHGMHTRALTLAASRRAVFDTQELLEGILAHLSAYELGRVQGVCTHWKKTVGTVPALRRARFMVVEKKAQILWYDPVTKTVTLPVPEAEPAMRDSKTLVQTSTLNTLFFARAQDGERDTLPERCVMCETLTFALSTMALDAELEAAWSIGRQTGMLGMLVANPPPVSVELEVAFTLARTAMVGNKKKNKGPKTVRGIRPAANTISNAANRPLHPERHSVDRPKGVTWGDILREIDAVLHVAKMKLRRQSPDRQILERQKGGKELVIEWEKSCVWMKGVLFVGGREMEAMCSVAQGKTGAAGEQAT